MKKNHGVLTLQSIQLNGHAMVLSVLDSLGNKTCGIIPDMFQCFFSFPLVSLHLHSSINYTNLSVRVCQVAQSCLTLSDLMDCSLPGSSVHGIFQARVLEWGAIAFSECYLYFNVNILLALIGTRSHPMRSGRKGVSPLP